MTDRALTLHHGDSTLTFCPHIGASIAQYTWRGIDILRPASPAALRDGLVRQMAYYPLVPYSNRIGQAMLLAGGQAWRLRANAPPEPHALHGIGWQRAWQVASHTSDTAQMQLLHAADADWPFAFDARETIRLDGDMLQLQLALRNTDTRPMPAGLGFHPYFPAGPQTRLQADWRQMWQAGADALPTALAARPAESDFSSLRPVAGWRVDNCFTGWNGHAMLDYPSHQVHLTADDACRHLVCFAPDDGRPFIALEPVSHVNNAFALAARGVPGTGSRMLAPGESMEISMSLRVVGVD